MKLIKVPEWWDSIRAIIALVLVLTTCSAVFVPKEYVSDKELSVLKDLTMMVITFYYVLKKRNGSDETKGETK